MRDDTLAHKLVRGLDFEHAWNATRARIIFCDKSAFPCSTAAQLSRSNIMESAQGLCELSRMGSRQVPA